MFDGKRKVLRIFIEGISSILFKFLPKIQSDLEAHFEIYGLRADARGGDLNVVISSDDGVEEPFIRIKCGFVFRNSFDSDLHLRSMTIAKPTGTYVKDHWSPNWVSKRSEYGRVRPGEIASLYFDIIQFGIKNEHYSDELMIVLEGKLQYSRMKTIRIEAFHRADLRLTE